MLIFEISLKINDNLIFFKQIKNNLMNLKLVYIRLI
jgi:hypothetical protein